MRMYERYELRNEDGELIRIFQSLEEGKKSLTNGDYLVQLVEPKKPRVSPFEIAFRLVGNAPF